MNQKYFFVSPQGVFMQNSFLKCYIVRTQLRTYYEYFFINTTVMTL